MALATTNLQPREISNAQKFSEIFDQRVSINVYD